MLSVKNMASQVPESLPPESFPPIRYIESVLTPSVDCCWKLLFLFPGKVCPRVIIVRTFLTGEFGGTDTVNDRSQKDNLNVHR